MKTRSKQSGVAYLTTLIAIPVLGALIGCALQLGLLYQAKSVLNHAVFNAARAGAVKNAQPLAINTGLAKGLLPLYVANSSYAGMTATVYSRVLADVLANSCIKILNPNRGAFTDFDVTAADPRRDNSIAYYELNNLPTTVGAASGTSIQDAMILQVYVLYGARAEVPLIGPIITRVIAQFGRPGGRRAELLARQRIPIVAEAKVRMNSNARLSAMVAPRGSATFSC